MFVAPPGEKLTGADHRAVIDALPAEVSRGSQVAAATDPFEARR